MPCTCCPWLANTASVKMVHMSFATMLSVFSVAFVVAASAAHVQRSCVSSDGRHVQVTVALSSAGGARLELGEPTLCRFRCAPENWFHPCQHVRERSGCRSLMSVFTLKYDPMMHPGAAELSQP